VGQIGLKLIGDEVHVMTLAVRPEHRRRGHARALVRAALDLAAAKGAATVHLEVRPSNEAALSLYLSLGFVQTGRRPRYYGDEDALLLTLTLVG
jgi:ribosomal-protein-alanine N-acetyltransferase